MEVITKNAAKKYHKSFLDYFEIETPAKSTKKELAELTDKAKESIAWSRQLEWLWSIANWDALRSEYHEELTYPHYSGLDIETTGFSPGVHSQIIELSIILLDNDIEEKRSNINTLVRFMGKVPKKITDLTGITTEMVKNYNVPGKTHLMKEVYSFAADTIVVAHNANFEKRFLDFYMNKNQLPFDNTYIDTMKIMKLLFPSVSSYTLDSFLDLLSIENKKSHSAFYDATSTLEAFNRVRKLYLKHYELADRVNYDISERGYNPVKWKVIARPRYWSKAPNTQNPKSRLYVQIKDPNSGEQANIFYDYIYKQWDYNNQITHRPLDFSEIEKEIVNEMNLSSIEDLNDFEEVKRKDRVNKQRKSKTSF